MIKKELQIALDNFKRHKVRTVLSMLGIIIGILAVSMILSLGQGVKGYVNNQVTSFGTNIITVATKVPGKGNIGSMTSMVQGITITSLKQDDFEAIEKFDFVSKTTCYNFSQTWVTHEDKENNSYLFASTPEYINIDEQAKLKKGRFYNEQENKAAQKVVVIGSSAKESLFEEKSAINKEIKIKGSTFKVIGVLEERGQMAGFNYDNMVYVPLKTGQKVILGVDYVMEGMAKIKPNTNMEIASNRITSLMRRRHNISDPEKDDFQVMSMEEALEIANQVTGALSFLLTFLASISLLVGGVGIMNIMLVSLSERIREVGLRKAVGARDKDIFRQFLVESTLLTATGGLIGVGLAVIFTVIAGVVVKSLGVGWQISFPLMGVLIALSISVGVGLLFGLYPARKAANLDPIDAIREE